MLMFPNSKDISRRTKNIRKIYFWKYIWGEERKKATHILKEILKAFERKSEGETKN